MGRKPNLTKAAVIGLIVALGTFLRLYHLETLPPSLYWEEAALGYDALSISQTGKDYHGNTLPIVAFSSFGDYKPSAYFYATAVAIKTLGAGDFAVRLPSAASGIIAIAIVYFICRQLKLDEGTSLLAAFILAIMPWHIQFSRAAFEVNLGTTLFLLGILFLLKARLAVKFFYPATVFFATSMYAYHGLRVLSPLMALSLFLLYRKQFNFKLVLANLMLSLILIYPIISNIGSPAINQRFRETSFLSQSTAVISTNQLRAEYGNSLLARIIFHRYWWWVGELTGNYLKNVDLNFLFISGDGNPRHGVGEFGPLYHWQLLAIVTAIYFSLQRKPSGELKAVWIWLLLTPIPVMLTATNPHTLRLLPAAPAYAILSAYGITAWLTIRSAKKAWLSLIGVIIGIESLAYGHFYTTHYPKLSAREWQSQYREVVTYVENIKSRYQTIYFTRAYGRPSIYVLWYGQYDPMAIQAEDSSVPKDQQELLAVEKYQFTAPPAHTPGSLIVSASVISNQTARLLTTFSFPDREPAFYLYEQN